MKTKFVVVLGALMSGMGKGIVTSSILQILDFYGYNALPIKFDGYLNYDCGTMNPYRHGEVFVLDDKSEVDMDFGIYERFLNKDLTGDLSITGGKLFSNIIEKERKGGFLGDDVQIIPHLTGEILERIKNIANEKNPDVLIIEVGGTVGDIENSYFIEAMRQLSLEEKVTFVALTYLPFIDVVGEQKTKPTQIAFRSIMNTGIRPTFLVCRSDKRVLEKTKEKLSLFTNIKKDYIIDDSTQDTLYRMPLHFIREGFDKKFIDEIGLDGSNLSKKKISELESVIERIVHPTKEVNIAIVGKYVGLTDAYTSVKEALIHSGAKLDCKINIDWVEAEDL
ncbi:MAG: CTP synthase [Candidatus Marsarchaeota archaeon]|nr:CTP synthase [Candidatus Marsarchaeota archaeon]